MWLLPERHLSILYGHFLWLSCPSLMVEQMFASFQKFPWLPPSSASCPTHMAASGPPPAEGTERPWPQNMSPFVFLVSSGQFEHLTPSLSSALLHMETLIIPHLSSSASIDLYLPREPQHYNAPQKEAHWLLLLTFSLGSWPHPPEQSSHIAWGFFLFSPENWTLIQEDINTQSCGQRNWL